MASVQEQIGFFHYSAKHVRAREKRRADRIVVAYMRQLTERSLRNRTRVSDPATYMLRQLDLEGAQLDVLYHRFYDRGSGLTSDKLWKQNERKNRGKNGLFKRNGGHLPRLGSFITASLPYGVSLEDAIVAVDRHAEYLGSALGVACEAVIHAKRGKPDHAHFFVTDRVVDANGVGAKQRAMNGMAAKIGGDGIEIDDGYLISGPMEDMRASWASIIRDIAPPNTVIDHRSFERRGFDIEPVTYISQGEVRSQEAVGLDMWRRDRDNELGQRTVLWVSGAADRAAADPAQAFRFLALAGKPRGRRARRNHDAEIATMAYAARLAHEQRNGDERTFEVESDRRIGEPAAPTISASRKPDIVDRPRKRRSPRWRDAEIAVMALAARRQNERTRQDGRGARNEPVPQGAVRLDAPATKINLSEIVASAPGAYRLEPSAVVTVDPTTPIAAPETVSPGLEGEAMSTPVSPPASTAAIPSLLAPGEPPRRRTFPAGKDAALALLAYLARLKRDALPGRSAGAAVPLDGGALLLPVSPIDLHAPAEPSRSRQPEEDRQRQQAAEPPRSMLALVAAMFSGLRWADAKALLTFTSHDHSPSEKSSTTGRLDDGRFAWRPKTRSRRRTANDPGLALAVQALAAKRDAAQHILEAEAFGSDASFEPVPSAPQASEVPESACEFPASPEITPWSRGSTDPATTVPGPTHVLGQQLSRLQSIVVDPPSFHVLEEGHVAPGFVATPSAAPRATERDKQDLEHRHPASMPARRQGGDAETEGPPGILSSQNPSNPLKNELHRNGPAPEVASNVTAGEVSAARGVSTSSAPGPAAIRPKDHGILPPPDQGASTAIIEGRPTPGSNISADAAVTPEQAQIFRPRSTTSAELLASGGSGDRRGLNASVGAGEKPPEGSAVRRSAPFAGPDSTLGQPQGSILRQETPPGQAMPARPDATRHQASTEAVAVAPESNRRNGSNDDGLALSGSRLPIAAVNKPAMPSLRQPLEVAEEQRRESRLESSKSSSPPPSSAGAIARPAADHTIFSRAIPMSNAHLAGQAPLAALRGESDGRARLQEDAGASEAVASNSVPSGAVVRSTKTVKAGELAASIVTRPADAIRASRASSQTNERLDDEQASQGQGTFVEGPGQGLLDHLWLSMTPSKAEVKNADVRDPSARRTADASHAPPKGLSPQVVDPRARLQSPASATASGPIIDHGKDERSPATPAASWPVSARHGEALSAGEVDDRSTQVAVVAAQAGDRGTARSEGEERQNDGPSTTPSASGTALPVASRGEHSNAVANRRRLLVLRYAAVLRRDRQFSRAILTLVQAYVPGTDIGKVEHAVAGLDPLSKSRAIKDEIRAGAIRLGDSHLLQVLDAMDGSVRQARREAANSKRGDTENSNKGGRDPADR